MDIHHLKTLVAVARMGSITRASDSLHLSQPAVSAHIKVLEDTLGICLFARTARGMCPTPDGQRLLAKAEEALSAHNEFIHEAKRIRGGLKGTFRLGGGIDSVPASAENLLLGFSTRYPEVEVTLQHGNSTETLTGIRSGNLDAGFYNEDGEPSQDLMTVEIARFKIYVAAKSGLRPSSLEPLDWQSLADIPWIFSNCSLSCCGKAAENIFRRHQFRPKRIISVDRESVTRKLIAQGVGIGLLHADETFCKQSFGEIDLIAEVQKSVRVMFAFLANRSKDPLLCAAKAMLFSCAH